MKELEFFEAEKEGHGAHRSRIVTAFTEHLAKNGLRLTGQRRRILDLFLDSDHHLSQDEIYHAVRAHGVGRATVFRTIKMLQESRLISPVVGPGGAPRYEIEVDRPHHDHLICVSCGRIQEVRWPKLEKIQEATCRRIGFVPKWHRHEIFGLCKDCSKA